MFGGGDPLSAAMSMFGGGGDPLSAAMSMFGGGGGGTGKKDDGGIIGWLKAFFSVHTLIRAVAIMIGIVLIILAVAILVGRSSAAQTIVKTGVSKVAGAGVGEAASGAVGELAELALAA